MEYLFKLCRSGRKALSCMNNSTYNKDIYSTIANLLIANLGEIIKVSQENIIKIRRNKFSENDIKRCIFDKKKIYELCSYVIEIGNMDIKDNDILIKQDLSNDIAVRKTVSPLGQVALVYDRNCFISLIMAVMCIKSGNSLLLIGSEETYSTDKLIIDIVRKAMEEYELPKDLIQLFPCISGKKILNLFEHDELFDYRILYGIGDRTNYIKKNTSIDFFSLYESNTCIYIDNIFGLNLIVDIVNNFKLKMDSICFLINERFMNDMTSNIKLDIAYKVKMEKVKHIEEAIEFINNNKFIVTSCVFSDNKGQKMLFKKKVLSGELYINTLPDFIFYDGSENFRRSLFCSGMGFTRPLSPEILTRSKCIIEKMIS